MCIRDRPYTVQHVAELAKQGKKNIAVIAPAFSADCIETLEEINGEIRESFLHAGGEEFTYIPCLNDDSAHITAPVSYTHLDVYKRQAMNNSPNSVIARSSVRSLMARQTCGHGRARARGRGPW